MIEDIEGFRCPNPLCEGHLKTVRDEGNERIWKCDKCGEELKGDVGRAVWWKRMGEISLHKTNRVANGKE